MINIEIPAEIANIIGELNLHYYDAHVCGECVFRLLKGDVVADYDVVTNAEYSRVCAIFDGRYTLVSGVEERGEYLLSVLGVSVLILCSPLPLAEFLREGVFSAKSIAYAPKTGFFDPFGGLNCFTKRAAEDGGGDVVTLDTTQMGGAADKKEQSDETSQSTLTPEQALLTLSMYACGEYTPADATREMVNDTVPLFDKVDSAGMREKLNEIMLGKHVTAVLCEFTEVFFTLFPELRPLYNLFEQEGDEHCLYTRSARAAGYAPPVLELRYALLFAYLGKPDTMSVDFEGRSHFYGHAALAEIMAGKILKRLEMDAQVSEDIKFLTLNHDFTLHDMKKEHESVTRALRVHTNAELRNLLLLRYAKLRAKSDALETEANVFKRIAGMIK